MKKNEHDVPVVTLSGAQLDYWVSRAEGIKVRWVTYEAIGKEILPGGFWHIDANHPFMTGYAPSTSWDQGGQIIDRECITLIARGKHLWGAVLGPQGDEVDHNIDQYDWRGETALIAAMRCFVASKFGEFVSVESGDSN